MSTIEENESQNIDNKTPVKIIENVRRYQKKHKAKYNKYQADYRDKNLPKVKEWRKKCYKRRYNDPELREEMKRRSRERYWKLKAEKEANQLSEQSNTTDNGQQSATQKK